MLVSWLKRIPNLVAGLLAGVVAAIVTIFVMVLGRYYLGIMPPFEAVPDRIASTLDIETFFSLFGKYGGYNGLKQFGILSGLRGIVVTGAVVGILYALVLESVPSRRSPRWIMGTSRPAFLFVALAVLVVWIGFVIFLWPVLPANFRGVPFTQARILSILALLVWFATFGLTVIGTYRFIGIRFTGRTRPDNTDDDAQAPAPAGAPPERVIQPLARPSNRRAILAAAAGGALTFPIYRILRDMYNDATFSYDGQTFHRETITPITPTELFYTVTKNVVDPQVDRDLWRLEIGGHVDNPRTYSFDDLQDFEQIDQETTLMCISNRVGSGLFSNANWRGVRLRDLLQASGVREGAVEVLISGADAYSDTFAIDKALAEETLVVYQINGEPLPREHGYPVRIIVPGLYGEKNVKWVTRVDVVDHDAKGFYESQGWGPNFMPQLRSDIFAPLTGGNDSRGGWQFTREFRVNQAIEIKGRAFDPNLGIGTVELSTDGGSTWNPTEIYYPGTEITWSLWTFTWTPPGPGEYVLIPRATSKTGEQQLAEATSIVPQGARGYQKVRATVIP
jgi:DMSO/TMAO reductase YedYZ molybdopterin-dependent catalytic subunit